MMKFLLLPILCLTSPFSFAISLTPGEYELQTEIKTELPQAQNLPKSHTAKTCIEKPQDARKLMEDALKGSECKIGEFKDLGTTASWKMTCSLSGVEAIGGGKMKAAKDSFTGDSHMTIKIASMELKSTATHTGKRIGACPVKDKK